MAWSEPGDGIWLFTARRSEFISTTSTSTINLNGTTEVHGHCITRWDGDALRMFNFNLLMDIFDQTGLSITASAVSPTHLPGAEGCSNFITYMDSVDLGSGCDPVFQIDAEASVSQIVNTVVPSLKPPDSGRAWPYLFAHCYDDGTRTVETIAPPSDQDLAVTYKNPCVVRLPSNTSGKGWLMLLSRERRYNSIAAVAEPGDTDFAISDIVAYLADEDCPGFDDGEKVAGPFLIASSIGALPGPDAVNVRFFLSVPSAVVMPADGVGMYQIAVYYTVISTRYGVDVDKAVWPSLLMLLAPLDRSYVDDFNSCIGVKILRLDDLLACVDSTVRDWDDENLWESDTTGAYEVPGVPDDCGNVCRRVYVWSEANGSLVEKLESYGLPEETVPAFFRLLYVSFADPQFGFYSLERTPTEIDTIRLFLAAVLRRPIDPDRPETEMVNPLYHGLWMAAPLDDGEVGALARKAGETSSAMRGVDFVLTTRIPFRPATKEEPVEENRPGTVSLPLDPDPVRLSDHTWRLYHGNSVTQIEGEDIERVPLSRMIGEDGDVFSGCWIRYPFLLSLSLDCVPLPLHLPLHLPLRMADSITPYHAADLHIGVYP